LEIYADAEAPYIPFVFTINPLHIDLGGDIVSLNLSLVVDGTSHTLITGTSNLYPGDLIYWPDLPPGNTYTLLIPENSYDSITVTNGKTTDAKYELTVQIAQCSQPLTAEKELNVFADATVQCIEIGVNETNITASDFQNCCWKEPEKGWQLPGPPFYDIEDGYLRQAPVSPSPPHIDLNWDFSIGGDSYSTSYSPTVNQYELTVHLYDSISGGVIKHRAGQFHAQRGFYFVVYYGRKTITLPDSTTAEIVDVEKDDEVCHISAWGGSAKFSGMVYSDYTDESADIPAIGISVVGMVWSAVSLDPVGFVISLASAIYSGIPDVESDDDATVYSENYLVINNESGDPVDSDRDFITTTNGWGPSGYHTKNFVIGAGDNGLLDFGATSGRAMRTIYCYNTSSITCTDWSIFLFDSEVASHIKFDPGDDKVKVVWP